jgi:hypothetical protein
MQTKPDHDNRKRTISQGDITITLWAGESYATGLGIIETVARYRERRAMLERLKDAKHGHAFGDDRVCECGLRIAEYYETWWYQLTVCPAYHGRGCTSSGIGIAK